MARAAVMTIGDELLAGRVADTNGALITGRLRMVGIDTVYLMTCRDDLDEICRSLRFCHERADVVITTGGLGPTDDDVTHEAVARYLGVELELRAEELARIVRRFAAFGMEMPATNERSARLPAGALVVPNDHGTAPGCITDRAGKVIISLPGVPRELGPMLEQRVIPFLGERLSLGGVTRTRVLKTFGFTESKLAELISPIPLPDPALHVGYRPTFPEIHLLLSARGPDDATAQGWIDSFEASVRASIPDQLWGVDEQEFAAVVGALLRSRGWRMASAESCTGGLVSKLMTDVAGSSDYFDRGFATYTNEAKQQMIGVPAEIFAPDGTGAVSERCALEMAQGARAAAGVDVAVSTTGIAGPGGGTPDKPVGTVWIGLATAEGATARIFHFPGDRRWVRTLTAYVALERLRRHLLGIADVDRFRGRSTKPQDRSSGLQER